MRRRPRWATLALATLAVALAGRASPAQATVGYVRVTYRW